MGVNQLEIRIATHSFSGPTSSSFFCRISIGATVPCRQNPKYSRPQMAKSSILEQSGETT